MLTEEMSITHQKNLVKAQPQMVSNPSEDKGFVGFPKRQTETISPAPRSHTKY